MKLLYVAGAFTAPTPWLTHLNVQEAREYGALVAELGVCPVVPHLIGEHYQGIATPEFWYDATLELAKACDGILMLPRWSESKGACVEHEKMRRLGRAIFQTGAADWREQIKAWGAT